MHCVAIQDATLTMGHLSAVRYQMNSCWIVCRWHFAPHCTIRDTFVLFNVEVNWKFGNSQTKPSLWACVTL